LPENDILAKYYISTSKKIKNDEIISSVPVVHKTQTEIESYEDYNLYNIIFKYIKDDNSYKVISPNILLTDSLIVGLRAFINTSEKYHELETCEFTISNHIPSGLYLYEHDTNANVCE
jgi:hypothetical protein